MTTTGISSVNELLRVLREQDATTIKYWYRGESREINLLGVNAHTVFRDDPKKIFGKLELKIII